MGVCGRKLDVATVERLLRERRRGLKPAEIARQMGIDPRTVRKHLQQSGAGEQQQTPGPAG